MGLLTSQIRRRIPLPPKNTIWWDERGKKKEGTDRGVLPIQGRTTRSSHRFNLEEASYAISPISLILPVWELATLGRRSGGGVVSFLLCTFRDPALVLTRGPAAKPDETPSAFLRATTQPAEAETCMSAFRVSFLSATEHGRLLRLGRGDLSYGCRYGRRNEVIEGDEDTARG
jgi:hypothetical protein